MGINDRLKKAKENTEKIDKAAKELNKDASKDFDKKKYDKEYSSKKATIKINKDFHKMAKVQSAKRFMTVSKYIEHLIDKDSNNFPTEY